MDAEQDDETREERPEEPQPDQAADERRDEDGRSDNEGGDSANEGGGSGDEAALQPGDDLPALDPEPGLTAPLDHVTEEESGMEPVVVMPGTGPGEEREPPGDAGRETGAAEEPDAGGKPETGGEDQPRDGEGTRR